MRLSNERGDPTLARRSAPGQLPASGRRSSTPVMSGTSSSSNARASTQRSSSSARALRACTATNGVTWLVMPRETPNDVGHELEDGRRDARLGVRGTRRCAAAAAVHLQLPRAGSSGQCSGSAATRSTRASTTCATSTRHCGQPPQRRIPGRNPRSEPRPGGTNPYMYTDLSMYNRQMPVDQNLLAEASAAAGRVTELEDQLEGAKAEYRRAVRRLHLAGASMREVAEALGVSHQRIHQIIEDGGVRRWRRRRRQEPTAQRVVVPSAGASSDRSASSSQGRACTSATPASWPPSVSPLPGDRRRIRYCSLSPPAASLSARSAGKHASRCKPSCPRQLAKSTLRQRSATNASGSAGRSSLNSSAKAVARHRGSHAGWQRTTDGVGATRAASLRSPPAESGSYPRRSG